MKRITGSDELKEVVETYNFAKVAFDTETTDLEYDKLELCGMSFYNGTEAFYVDLHKNTEFNDLMKIMSLIFSDKIKILICHNIVFDLKVLYKYGITCDHIKIYDTMVADHLIDERREHGLKALTRTLLHRDAVEYQDAAEEGFNSMAFAMYACADVINTYDLCVYQQPILRAEGLASLFRDIEMPFQFVLLEMAVQGILIDHARIEPMTKEVVEELQDLEIGMYRDLGKSYQVQFDLQGGMTVVGGHNFRSNQEIADILYKQLGFTCEEFTEAGAPSVSRDILEPLRSKHPFVDKLYRYKLLQKILSSFLVPLPKFTQADGRVRPSFHNCGTETGRLSSSTPNCLSVDTELLTKTGWRRVADVNVGEDVMTFDEDSKRLVWGLVEQTHRGESNSWMHVDSQHISMLCTTNHRHLLFKRKSKRKVVVSGKFPSDHLLLHTSEQVMANKQANDWLQRLAAAYQADGSLGVKVLDFSFTKGRKYLRLQIILNSLGVLYKDYSNNKRFRISVPVNQPAIQCLFEFVEGKNKLFSHRIVTSFGAAFCEELKFWDGLSTRDEGEWYCSVIKHNIDVVHSVLCCNGYRAKINKQYNRISVSRRVFSYTTNAVIKYDNTVRPYACVSVKNDNILVRRGGVAWITKNCQQLPRVRKEVKADIRSLFIADANEAMLSSDFTSQELRIIAHVSQEPSMIEAFFKGKDFHLQTAKEMFKLDIPDEALYETHEKYNEYKKKYNEQRTKSKIINFSVAYGKGPKGFADDFGVSEAEAQQILERYFTTYPNIKRAIDEAHRFVKEHGYIASVFQRRRRFAPVEKDGNTFYTKASLRQSFNHIIQGTGADMMRLAAIKCLKLKKDNPAWDLKIIASIHDEFLFTVRKVYAETAAQKIKEAFESCCTLRVPVVSSVNIGQNYSELK